MSKVFVSLQLGLKINSPETFFKNASGDAPCISVSIFADWWYIFFLLPVNNWTWVD